ncbi:MAG: glycosyltransferase family 4 protein [Bryobacteraceae bacterium]|jgi:polysaccharide biosynthesis protein PslH
MKLLWVKTDFLHPTTRGGQIRTLETLRRLHQWHEVHYVAFDDPAQPEGLARSFEYCAKAYPVAHRVAEKTSVRFALQLVEGLFSRMPVAVSRYRSAAMRRKLEELLRRERFDSVVCDFLFPSPNFSRLEGCVLFQHNVESTIWKRYVEHNSGLKKLYFQLQAKRMSRYEGKVCRSVRKVVAVSDGDAEAMRREYKVERVFAAPTGVDLDYFARPEGGKKLADMVFLGSMDWMPNIDGVTWFAREVLPLIHAKMPECTLAIAGRRPAPEVSRLAEKDRRIKVTGTVPDVRPWLFGSLISIVPLRIGGGTRLKIYESMAAGTPVVSTAVGAEGLDVSDGANICLSDSPADFAGRCLQLLENATERERLSRAAWELVASKYSWDVVARGMERLLFD